MCCREHQPHSQTVKGFISTGPDQRTLLGGAYLLAEWECLDAGLNKQLAFQFQTTG